MDDGTIQNFLNFQYYNQKFYSKYDWICLEKWKKMYLIIIRIYEQTTIKA